VKVGDLVKPSSNVQLLDSPFLPHEWGKVFLVVGIWTFAGNRYRQKNSIYIWRDKKKFLINRSWLEVISESR
jgi:hypothetical protein